MGMDSIHILGGKMGDDWIPGDAGALRQIYRVHATTADTGERALRTAARSAYQKTQSALMSSEELRGFFSPPFLNGIRDFDELVTRIARCRAGGRSSYGRRMRPHDCVIRAIRKNLCRSTFALSFIS